VKNPEQYKIAFSSLTPGTHIFDFQIDSTFFEEGENTGIISGNIAVNVTMMKEERMMDLHFSLRGAVVVPCDRCLEPVEVEVKGNERLIIKLGDRYVEETDEIQIIPDTEHQVDLAPFLYEFVYLMVPMRRVHDEDEDGNSLCDPEILKKISELNPEKEPDPRWEALNKLKGNLE
jgi:uncharacterized metal-binding protein YceD (DUF177 family)